MQIIQSGVAAPLKYTDPTYQSLLFIRANIYDTSGVSPSLEGTVNLALIDNGTYWGKYTFTAGKTYLVQKLVYTDGTYTTVDQDYAQDNDNLQCLDLKLENLDVAISTRLASGDYTAPDNAGIAAIQAQTDQFTFQMDGVDAHVNNSPVIDEAAIADAVWDEAIADHVAVGSFGLEVQSGADAEAIADAVWDEATADHVATGSFGLEVQSGESGGSQASSCCEVDLEILEDEDEILELTETEDDSLEILPCE